MDVLEAGTALDAAIVSHYARVAPIMEQIFGRIPIVWTTVPLRQAQRDNGHAQGDKADQRPIYHGKFFGHYSHLSSEHVQHLASIGAQEFHSWFPLPEDEERARFARFLLERPWADTQGALLDSVRRGAQIVRDLILSCHGEPVEPYGAIPVLDGVGGVSIFVPLSGGPAYPDVRLWAHAIARKAIAAHPQMLSEAHNVQDDGRVHIHISSNARGLFSIMPYSVRTTGTRVATPVTWDELQSADMRGVMMHDFPARLDKAGDVFGELLRRTTPHALPSSAPAVQLAVEPLKHGRKPHVHRHGEIVSTVCQILSDGQARTPAEIWKIAHEQHLPCSHTVGDLSSNVWAYIERQTARGLKPVIVGTADHKFRLNEPPDAWPDAVPAKAEHKTDVEALITRLTQAATDSQNPANFEIAVCDAFAALGLLTTHVGGLGAPDGYGDAPLATMGYRVMFECKSGTTLQKSPNIFEASKYKDAYHAKYCAIIGSQSGTEQQEALSEIKTHGVSLWGADDIVYALRAQLTPLEIEAAFAPGAVAQDVLPDIVWARDHGPMKRVRVIAEIVRSVGWTTQCAAAQANTPTDAPLLTVDAAMLLVDQELAVQGSHVNCTRDEVRLAFEWLTNPLNGAAVWDVEGTGIVVVPSAND